MTLTTLASTTSRLELLATLRAYDEHLDDLVAKNCGTGSGGFRPGNTCGRGGSGGNNPEGSARRQAAAKRRRRGGPGHALPPRSRQIRRKRAGRDAANRLNWREENKHDWHGAEGRQLLKAQTAERKDLADTFRQERKENRTLEKDSHKQLAKELRAERKEGRAVRAKERSSLKREQAREVTKLERTQAKESAKLEARQEIQRSRAKDPEKYTDLHREQREVLADEHAAARTELQEDHKASRSQLVASQRADREYERTSIRDQIESQRNDDKQIQHDQHNSQHDQIYDLRESHRNERAELKRGARESRRDDDKAYSFVDVKATPDLDGVPSAQSILAAALEATGHADAWEADRLTDEQRRELLEAVVTEGKRWFRSEAEALLGGPDEKALFGAARAKVGAFFDRAKKHVRELFTAGVLAVTGPGPANQTDAIVQETRKQVAAQIQYLDRFQSQIVSEEKPLNQAVASRAEMYGVSVWSATLEVQRQAAVAAGVKLMERRVLGPAEEHCDVCPELAARGWVKIGTLPKLGATPCMVYCRCHFEFK